MSGTLPERLAAWHTEEQQRLASEGVMATLHRSPDDGRSKAAAWVNLETPDALGEIIVWDSGECEVFAAKKSEAEPHLNEHRVLRDDRDLAQALAQMLDELR